MRKKVIDIFPSKKERKVVNVAIPEKVETKELPAEEKISLKVKRKKGFLRHIGNPIKRLGGFFKGLKASNSFPLFLLGLAFLFLFFIISYLTLSAAKIEIWPEGEVVNFEAKVMVDKNEDRVNFVDKIIPGQILEKEKTLSDTFSASGKVKQEKKAEGTIRVYNAYSTSAQVLVAATRFISVEGKLFRTPVKITIPGAWYERGKLIPGEVDIKVVADQPGAEYNIGPSTFSIPGFAGTDKYTKFYGKSFQQMTGGFSQEVILVTEADLRKAGDATSKKAKEEAETALKNDLKTKSSSEGLNFEPLINTIQTEVVERFTLATSGAEMSKFDFQVGAKSKTLIFREEDLDNFAKEFILSKIPQGKKIDQDSLRINFTSESSNLTLGQTSLALKISAKIYSDIDIPVLKNGLQGKSLTETKVFLENQPGITKVKVEFWPFWVKRVPEDGNKIKIKLNLGPVVDF